MFSPGLWFYDQLLIDAGMSFHDQRYGFIGERAGTVYIVLVHSPQCFDEDLFLIPEKQIKQRARELCAFGYVVKRGLGWLPYWEEALRAASTISFAGQPV